MGFCNYLRLSAAGQPLIVPVGGEGIFVSERPDVAYGPSTACTGADHHQVKKGFRRQHHSAVALGLSVEQIFAHNGNDLHVDSALVQVWQLFYDIHGRAGALEDHVAMTRSVRGKIADHVKPPGGSVQIGVGKTAAVGHGKIGPRHLKNDDADLGFARGDLRRGEVPWRNIIVVPEIQADGLTARKELPYLWSKNAEVGPGIRSRFRSGVRSQNVKHPHTKLAILILLAPHAGGRIHQWSERAVGAAERPHSRKFSGID